MNEALFNFLSWINSWVGSWGWAMVVFTILIRLALTPLDLRSRAGMRKTQKIQPKLAELQKKYANDKEKLNQKTAELYKKEGVNPMSSCLPLLLTWPILIIVFSAMRTAANREILAQVTQILNNETPTMETFLWIKNLWMPDSLFAPAWPDLNTLMQIPSDLWQSWFNGFGDQLPLLLKDLNLTAERGLCQRDQREQRMDVQPADYAAERSEGIQRIHDPADSQRGDAGHHDQDHRHRNAAVPGRRERSGRGHRQDDDLVLPDLFPVHLLQLQLRLRPVLGDGQPGQHGADRFDQQGA